MRIVFMGTPEFAVPVLTEIVGQGHLVAAVYTRAPKPGGRRGLEPTLSPVHAAALRFGLPVLTPSSLRTEDAAATLAAFEPDAIVVVAYGLILPKAILEIAPRACLNLHASLLPRWRGAAPIQRAIMAGDDETGVMVMAMEEGLDTGPVAMVERIEIGPEATADEIHDRLSLIGADLMVRALAAQNRGSLHFTPQAEEGVTYAKKIEKAEARIDWERPAAEVHNLIRALAPFPGAFFEADLGKGSERIKILRAHLVDGSGEPGEALDDALTIACGEGAIAIIELQRSGKAPMSAADFLRGARLSAGTRLAAQKSSDAAL
ncbi:10-formyltetrahydrofolate:L-methionyl-tRNA(fMet) N-formyltransferase [Methylocella tundrae]|uniref:Methionyl-tRNA formyltransferase n=1 Tax=Methylocella tundrae TaxID=227605 RepID=A0A8B6M9K3_METTU|nr:methionyl-tRNA formyltransferase [Methylocella tundrae]VTZ27683.1 Methionyl-tRNA formyltransferase [Methylocella tundrae]VTZ50995.1 10-formyltetrahydrofolate:L-methionyl-tRNA(fMet) N-formyltransferase [Methylocella tundrae]